VIFPARHAHLVISGKKTQSRRPRKPEHVRPPMRAGKSYPVSSGLGKPSIGRIEILAAIEQDLGDITFEDARAEGFKSRDDFFNWWRSFYGNADPSLPVWTYVFAPTIERRFLAKRPGQGDRMGQTRDYVSTPHMSLRDEPEVVPAEYQEKLIEQAAERWDAHIKGSLAEIDAMPLEARLARLRGIQRQGGNISRHLRAIESRIEAAEKKIGLRKTA
jgi:hypothetical protein